MAKLELYRMDASSHGFVEVLLDSKYVNETTVLPRTGEFIQIGSKVKRVTKVVHDWFEDCVRVYVL